MCLRVGHNPFLFPAGASWQFWLIQAEYHMQAEIKKPTLNPIKHPPSFLFVWPDRIIMRRIQSSKQDCPVINPDYNTIPLPAIICHETPYLYIGHFDLVQWWMIRETSLDWKVLKWINLILPFSAWDELTEEKKERHSRSLNYPFPSGWSEARGRSFPGWSIFTSDLRIGRIALADWAEVPQSPSWAWSRPVANQSDPIDSGSRSDWSDPIDPT